MAKFGLPLESKAFLEPFTSLSLSLSSSPSLPPFNYSNINGYSMPGIH